MNIYLGIFFYGIIALCLWLSILGYGAQREKWNRKRSEIAKRNMLNHCATDRDWRLINDLPR